MEAITKLLEANKLWASRLKQSQPDFFSTLSKQQNPEYLWIGCSDSRIPANNVINLLPGELFVHRNIANIVDPSDVNCLSVIEYAVSVLKVKHIILCGHYGCGGIQAATKECDSKLLDNWLTPVREIFHKYKDQLDQIIDDNKKLKTLCRLNIIEQIINISRTETIKKAWSSNQALSIHGLVYRLDDGLIDDLILDISGPNNVPTRSKTEQIAFLK